MLIFLNQSKLGISEESLAGAPRGGGGGGPAAAEAAPVEVKEKTIFEIKLNGFDAKAKIKIIKEVRVITGLGLKEVCFSLYVNHPSVILFLGSGEGPCGEGAGASEGQPGQGRGREVHGRSQGGRSRSRVAVDNPLCLLVASLRRFLLLLALSFCSGMDAYAPTHRFRLSTLH